MIPPQLLTGLLGAGGGEGGGLKALGGLTAGLIPAAFKFFSGIGQRRKARAMNPVDPQFQMNSQVIDNARILGDRYNNYTMPGTGQALNNMQTNYASSFANGAQGASSGGDVLDLATKLAYGQNQATNDLAYRTATGKENALNQYLGANAQAGQEYQAKNAYDRQQYERKLAEKAALMESGTQNMFGALDQGAQVAGKLLTPRTASSDPSQLSPQSIAQIQALLGNYAGAGVGSANGDLYNFGSVGINQQLKGKLPF